MSGGAFDYVSRPCDIADLARKRYQLEDLLKVLECYPGSERAVAATKAILAGMDALWAATEMDDPQWLGTLAGVWHAVEWTESCDTTPEYVAEALAAYDKAHPDGGQP